MRKFLACAVGLFALWLVGVFWAVHWIDKTDFNDFPAQKELILARFFWKSSPVINCASDANRALKFSWLSASIKIYRKDKKKMPEIIDILNEEFLFIAGYVKSCHKVLPLETKAAILTQLLTYLNRINLFQNYSDSDLNVELEKNEAMDRFIEHRKSRGMVS